MYLSWDCVACVGGGNALVGGLAFGWSDDGVTWHAADPGVPVDNLVVNTFFEAPAITSFREHGPMVVDQQSGYVYTALSCSPADGCPSNANKNQIGIVVGAPGSNPSNVGQFASETYQAVAVDGDSGVSMSDPSVLFPIITMDAAGTLYEAWIQGNSVATSGTPPAASLHVLYAYSKDRAHHYPTSSWSKPIRIDGPPSASAVMDWIVAGDAGKLGAIWLGSNLRENPSQQDARKEWHPYMAISTNADTPTPTFQQTQVGMGPNHLSDVCLQGTVGCIQNVGNRNMADFISVDIGPDGALQGTWANDSNLLHTLPTTLIPGLPLTETARQVSGPRLIGGGDVSDARFSVAPQTSGAGSDAAGDALFPVQGGSNVPQLDLTESWSEWNGTNLKVHMSIADLSSTASPDTSNQNHVWYLTTWQFNHGIYFAKAESDSGGALTFTAGVPASYDRPGLNGQTVATLVDYRGGTTVMGQRSGNEIVITVPPSVVGSPSTGALLEAVTAYTVLDNGNPPFVTAATGNIPTVVDATAAYNASLVPTTATPSASSAGSPASGSSQSAPASIPNTAPALPSVGVVAATGALALGGAAALGRRRRAKS